MNQTIRNILIGIVAFIVIVVLGYFAWKERGGSAAPSSTSSSATSTIVSINVGTSTSSTSGYTVTPIYATSTPAAQAPNYKKPLTFSADVTAGEQAAYESQFAAVQTTLASNPTDYSSWIELGVLREDTSDYQGAAADWKYVTEVYPTDPTAYANLGDLYANYLSQPAQGEAYYKQAIALEPTKEATFYENLAQIYAAQGDTADAKATLQQGINAKVVGYQNLQTELNSIQ
jgi:tetratricopeptide (TPR) repeat protein